MVARFDSRREHPVAAPAGGAMTRDIDGVSVTFDASGRAVALDTPTGRLRAEDILQEENAITPARRIYFVIQLMCLETRVAEALKHRFIDLLADYMKGARIQEVRDALVIMRDLAAARRYRDALKISAALVDVESALVD